MSQDDDKITILVPEPFWRTVLRAGAISLVFVVLATIAVWAVLQVL